MEKNQKEEGQDALLKAVSSKWSYDKIMEFIQSNTDEIEE